MLRPLGAGLGRVYAWRGEMQLELRHLRYFLAVAEELNFSRAAERLHIAQPALSAQIRTLETQLGCDLFQRTTRKVELTPAGRLLLPDARDLVERADLAAAKLVAAARGQQGLLRVGFVAHGAGELSTAILRRFGEELPAIEVELVEARTLEGSQRMVAAQETDAAFVWLPILHDELVGEPVAHERKLVAMHPEHRLASKSVVDVADLVDEPIVAPWDHYSPETIAHWLAPFRQARKPGDLFAESLDECMNFVIRGLAVYCVPESVERFYGRPDVAFRPLRGAEPAAVALAWHREAQNPAVPRFVEVTRTVLADQAEAPVPIQSRRR
jgi:DNA-binding transcriptional LysR family regulator